MNKPDIRVAIVILKDDQILLVKHRKAGRQYWLLPGGRVEWNEDLHSALKRELLEETNLQIEVGQLIFINDAIPKDGSRHIVNLFFEGRLLGGELRQGEEEILAGVEFVKISELDNLPFFPCVKRELLTWLKQRRFMGYLGNRWESV